MGLGAAAAVGTIAVNANASRTILEFRIADTFTDSLARLTAQEQKAAKTTAFDLQMDPSSPGLSFHKLDRAKDTNFWSVRVNDRLRVCSPPSESMTTRLLTVWVLAVVLGRLPWKVTVVVALAALMR